MRSLRSLQRLDTGAWRFLAPSKPLVSATKRMASCSAAAQPAFKLLQPFQEIEQQLIDSINAVEVYQQGHPHVFNMGKLTRRIRSDLAYIRQLSTQPPQQLTETRLQGCLNNLRGFKGEMMALQEAPGVVAVCKKFRTVASGSNQQQSTQLDSNSSSSDGSEGSDSETQQAGVLTSTGAGNGSSLGDLWQRQSSSNNGSRSPRAAAAAGAAELQVEIDVVADGGLTWIEVKNQELFGVQSGHFVGGSHGKGLADQVAHMLTLAAAPEHKRRGRSPQVVVFFPSGVDPEVEAALTELGAKVANGPGSLAPLCGVVGNNVTNLDVTTLCALVSEVTWRDPQSQALKDWAARTSHWRDCLLAQQQRPLLAELETVVGQDRELVVSCAATSQFEILLQQFSGPLERQRWSQLLPRLKVYHCTAGCNSSSSNGSTHSSNVSQQACAVCGELLVQCKDAQQQQQLQQLGNAAEVPQLDGAVCPLSQRLHELEKMTLLQQAVFSLGDALHALTLTANASAVRAAAACGVILDTQTHRPVWLTGL